MRWVPRSEGVQGDCSEAHVIRTGVVVPTFRDTPDEAFEVAHRAFAAGVDGVFCFDHLWPIGQPDRPALAPFPILATLAASYVGPPTPGGGPFFGTLVARTGLVPNAVLVNQFATLDALAPGRVIAGLGTGDRLSEAENLAYGIPFPPAAERRSDMVDLACALRRAASPYGWPADRRRGSKSRRGPGRPSTCGTPVRRWSQPARRGRTPSRSPGPGRRPRRSPS